MFVLSLLGIFIAYTLVGLFIGSLAHKLHCRGWDLWDTPIFLLGSIFWPLTIPILILLFVFRQKFFKALVSIVSFPFWGAIKLGQVLPTLPKKISDTLNKEQHKIQTKRIDVSKLPSAAEVAFNPPQLPVMPAKKTAAEEEMEIIMNELDQELEQDRFNNISISNKSKPYCQ